MPSLSTRIAYQNIALKPSEAALSQASQQVSEAAQTLSEIQGGTLDLDAVRVGGVRFVNSGGNLVPEDL